DLVGAVVGGGPGDGDGGRVGEGDLVRLCHGIGGAHEGVLGEGAVARNHRAEDLVAHGEPVDALTEGGDDTGDLLTHGGRQRLVPTVAAGADLVVDGVDTGGADPHSELTDSGLRRGPVDECLGLGA